LERSITVAEDVGDLQMKAWAESSLGEVHLNQGNLIKAKEYLDDGYTFLKKIGDKPGILEFYLLFGQFHTKKHEWAEARDFFKRAIKLADEMDNPQTLAKTYEAFGKMYVIKGDKEEGRNNLEEATKVYEKLGLSKEVEDIKDYQKLSGL